MAFTGITGREAIAPKAENLGKEFLHSYPFILSILMKHVV